MYLIPWGFPVTGQAVLVLNFSSSSSLSSAWWEVLMFLVQQNQPMQIITIRNPKVENPMTIKTTSFIPYWRFWFGENLKWKRRNKLMNNKSKLLNNLLIALLIKIFKIPFSIVILFDNIFKMISWLTVRDYLFKRYKMGSLFIEYFNFI